MVPLTVPFLRFPETELAFAVPETVPLAVPEIELEFAVFVDIFDLILLERIGPDPPLTSEAL